MDRVRNRARCMRAFAPVVLGITLTLAACGPSRGSSGITSRACVSGVLAVAAGTHGSLYVQDSRGIVHYSRTGKLLARFGPNNGDWTVDASGNVFILSGRYMEKLSPSGQVLLRWGAPMMEPEAVNSTDGDVLAVYGGANYAGSGPDLFELFSRGGKAIHRWKPSYSASLAFDRAGDVIATAETNAQLVAADPVTGEILFTTKPVLGSPYDVVGTDNHGDVYLGGENDSDTPFTVERVKVGSHGFSFRTINSSEESVSGLTVATNGLIYVVRNSYAESSSTDTGLEELSSSGSSQGKFNSCKHS